MKRNKVHICSYIRSESLSRSLGMAAISFILGLSFLALSLWFWEWGMMDGEGTVFTRQGWDERPLLERVFDPAKSDWGEYQGRELATLLNFFDSQWYLMLVKSGMGWWLAPLTGMVSYLLGGWILGWFSQRRGAGKVTTLSLMVLYWASLTASVTMAVYHRSSRPCLLPVLLLLLTFGYDRIHTPASNSLGRWCNAFVVLLLSLILGLIDRQGFIHSLLAGGVFFVLAYLRQRGGYRIAISTALGSALALAYDLVLGPAIIEAVNGYRPSLEFQRIDLRVLFQDFKYLAQAWEYLSWAVVHSVGGWFFASFVLVSSVVGVVKGKRWGPYAKSRGGRGMPVFIFLTGACVVTVVAALLVSFAAMIVRMDAIHTLYSTHLYYYPTSIHTWVLFSIVICAVSFPKVGAGSRIPQGILCVATVANLLSWKPHLDALWRCPWFSVVLTDSRALQKSIREKTADPGLDLTFAKLFARIAKVDPIMKKMKVPKATIGDGFYNAEFRAGRWMHWVEDEGFLKISPIEPGAHVLKLGLYDEGRGMPHSIEVRRDDQVIGTYIIPASGGWVDLELNIDLQKGETRLLFRGSLPKRMVPIQFPGAITSLSYNSRFALGIPELKRAD